jgi:hypothetical protein
MTRPTPWFARVLAAKDSAHRDDASRRKSARRRRPTLDSLEARQVLSTVTLTVTNDVDLPTRTVANANIYDHSLRGVIQQADAVPAGTGVVIDFNVDGGGFAEIMPVAPLPAITRPVTIDGTSEPLVVHGTATGPAPFTQIDGLALREQGIGSDGLDFTAGASGSVVKGLIVTEFTGAGLRFSGTSNVTLTNDQVGLKSTRTVLALDGNTVGVEFDGGTGETVNGVVVSGNTLDGIRLVGTTYSTVENSEIGTDPTGAYGTDSSGQSLGNGGKAHYGTGLLIDGGAQHNTATNNVISGNGTYGVLIANANTDFNTLTSNKIGADVSGSYAIPNFTTGVEIEDQASYNLVGSFNGFWSGGNLISGNGWDGVSIDGSGTVENEVVADRIGTNLWGNYAIANWNGIQLNNGSAYSFVYQDMISGNGGDAVFLGGGTYYDDVQNNAIGTDIFGNALGNGAYGIILVQGAWGNTIYANSVMYSSAWGLATFAAGGGNTYSYNNVVSNYGGNILWD